MAIRIVERLERLLDQSQLAELPAVLLWLFQAESTHRMIEKNDAYLADAAARLTATVEENVRIQLEHLQTYPTVVTVLVGKALNFHGWVYKFETGPFISDHPQDGQFVPLEGTSFETPSANREFPPN